MAKFSSRKPINRFQIESLLCVLYWTVSLNDCALCSAIPSTSFILFMVEVVNLGHAINYTS